MSKIAVYTAIAGSYDSLLPALPMTDVDFHAWVDKPVEGEGWQVHAGTRHYDVHPRMQAKQYKLQPHIFLPDYDITIWVDGSHRIISPFFAKEAVEQLGDADIAFYRHPWRDCIYDECVASLRLQKYDGQPMREQVRAYQAEGHPAHWGLWAGGTIVSRRSVMTEHLFDAWWGEVQHWSYQDQLSLPVVLRRLGVQPAVFAHHQLRSPWTSIARHRRDD